MTIIEKIKAEIERRIEAHHTLGHFCAEHEFRDVLSFISTLEKSEKLSDPAIEEPIDGVLYAAACGIKNAAGKSEKSVPNDLEEAAENYYGQDCPYPGEARVVNNEHDVWFPSQAIEDAFIAGAKWDREQMMKEAVEGKIIFLFNGDVAINIGDVDEYNLGDKVRLIVIPNTDKK